MFLLDDDSRPWHHIAVVAILSRKLGLSRLIRPPNAPDDRALRITDGTAMPMTGDTSVRPNTGVRSRPAVEQGAGDIVAVDIVEADPLGTIGDVAIVVPSCR